MQAAIAPRGDARTFLTHFVGSGLDDDRYVVEKFRSLGNGDIVPVQADGTKPKGRRKARGTILPLKAVEKMRPDRDEIIIARGGQANGVVWVKRLQRSDVHPAVSRFRQPQRFSLRGRRPPRCGPGLF